MKILIVEDEKGLRDNITSYFKEDGIVCENSGDLASAIDRLTLYDYDCVLLDIGLPDGEGFEVLEFLKANMKNEAVLIISQETHWTIR